jgi:hypothetical protein
MERQTVQDGDLVVHERHREGRTLYALRTAPGSDEVVYEGRDEALFEALALALRYHVSVWMSSERANELVLLSAPSPSGARARLRAGLEIDRRLYGTVERVRSEFIRAPGMRLNAEQVQRVCRLEPTACKLALQQLVDERFLFAQRDGTYVLVLRAKSR